MLMVAIHSERALDALTSVIKVLPMDCGFRSPSSCAVTDSKTGLLIATASREMFPEVCSVSSSETRRVTAS